MLTKILRLTKFSAIPALITGLLAPLAVPVAAVSLAAVVSPAAATTAYYDLAQETTTYKSPLPNLTHRSEYPIEQAEQRVLNGVKFGAGTARGMIYEVFPNDPQMQAKLNKRLDLYIKYTSNKKAPDVNKFLITMPSRLEPLLGLVAGSKAFATSPRYIAANFEGIMTDMYWNALRYWAYKQDPQLAKSRKMDVGFLVEMSKLPLPRFTLPKNSRRKFDPRADFKDGIKALEERFNTLLTGEFEPLDGYSQLLLFKYFRITLAQDLSASLYKLAEPEIPLLDVQLYPHKDFIINFVKAHTEWSRKMAMLPDK